MLEANDTNARSNTTIQNITASLQSSLNSTVALSDIVVPLDQEVSREFTLPKLTQFPSPYAITVITAMTNDHSTHKQPAPTFYHERPILHTLSYTCTGNRHTITYPPALSLDHERHIPNHKHTLYTPTTREYVSCTANTNLLFYIDREEVPSR